MERHSCENSSAVRQSRGMHHGVAQQQEMPRACCTSKQPWPERPVRATLPADGNNRAKSAAGIKNTHSQRVTLSERNP